MADPDKKEVTVRQVDGERFALDHHGQVALTGHECAPPMQHSAQIVHRTPAHQPLVHMVCWGEERACEVEVKGRVLLAGDAEAPVQVRIAHDFTTEHRQRHRVEPVDHTLHVDSQLVRPIHHALQMRTPLQMRFCNPWHLASDYVMEIRLGDRPLVTVHLTGATVATPQPCEDLDPCATGRT
ncbi:hypothetical protein [Paraburkholderia sp. XV]|uniref:hypothetical protein n=1 Tax=Paraburkholderia sp. XV TaxID=2831520 RepID=UPI001CD5896D|nr:hypothetical protein [Paraburkholderia sp. XV]